MRSLSTLHYRPFSASHSDLFLFPPNPFPRSHFSNSAPASSGRLSRHATASLSLSSSTATQQRPLLQHPVRAQLTAQCTRDCSRNAHCCPATHDESFRNTMLLRGIGAHTSPAVTSRASRERSSARVNTDKSRTARDRDHRRMRRASRVILCAVPRMLSPLLVYRTFSCVHALSLPTHLPTRP